MQKNNLIKKGFIYTVITLLIYVGVYFFCDNISNRTVIELNMKHTVWADVSVYYKDNKYDIRDIRIMKNVEAKEEFDVYKVIIPTKYVYGIDLVFPGAQDVVNTVNVKEIKLKTLFSTKTIKSNDLNEFFVDKPNNKINIIDGGVFTNFQLTTKVKLISLLISVFIVIMFRQKIDNLVDHEPKSTNTFKITLFVGSLVLMFLVNIVVLDLKFSAITGELAQKPTLHNYNEIFDKTYMNQWDKYLKEQILYRESFVEDYFAFNRQLQKKSFDWRYVKKIDGENVILTAIDYKEENIDNASNKVASLNEYLITQKKLHYIYLAPTKNLYYFDNFPTYTNDQTKDIIQRFTSNMNGKNLNVYDFYNDTVATSDETGNKPFFLTDHHWTVESAFSAYKKIETDLINDGIIESAQVNFTSDIYYDSFSGSDGKSIGYGYRFNQKKDDISIIHPEDLGSYTLFNIKDNTTRTGNALEIGAMEFLNQNMKYWNQYWFYDSLRNCKVTNNNLHNGKTLILLGDSFSRPVGYFLTQNFENVVFLDQRYLDKGYVLNYLENNEYDVVINLNNYGALQDNSLFEYFIQ